MMKRFLFFVMIIPLIFSCNKKDDDKPAVNKVPSCTISSPSDGQQFKKGKTVQIVAEVYDSDGYITKVTISIDDKEVYSSTYFPYIYTWRTDSVLAGNHVIKAIATDNDGARDSDQKNVDITDR